MKKTQTHYTTYKTVGAHAKEERTQAQIDERIARSPLLTRLLLECIEELAVQDIAHRIHPADPKKGAEWLRSTFQPGWLVKTAGKEELVHLLSQVYAEEVLDAEYKKTHPWM